LQEIKIVSYYAHAMTQASVCRSVFCPSLHYMLVILVILFFLILVHW